MPILKSAIKKQKQDKKRQKQNESIELKMSKAFKKALKSKTDKTVSAAFSAIDRAVKAKIIHQNKAARLKSKLVKGAPVKTATPTVSKKPKTKTASIKKKA